MFDCVEARAGLYYLSSHTNPLLQISVEVGADRVKLRKIECGDSG